MSTFESWNQQIPVDVLLLCIWSVNNLVGDGLVRHIVRATNANRLVPGHLTAKTPGGRRRRTKHKTTWNWSCCFSVSSPCYNIQHCFLTGWQKPKIPWVFLCLGRTWAPQKPSSEPPALSVPFLWPPCSPYPPEEKKNVSNSFPLVTTGQSNNKINLSCSTSMHPVNQARKMLMRQYKMFS